MLRTIAHDDYTTSVVHRCTCTLLARPRWIIPVTTFAVIRFFSQLPSSRSLHISLSGMHGWRMGTCRSPGRFPTGFIPQPGKTHTQRFQLDKSIINLISFSNVRMNFVGIFDASVRRSFDIQITYKKSIDRGFSIANAIEHQTKVFSHLPPSLRTGGKRMFAESSAHFFFTIES